MIGYLWHLTNSIEFCITQDLDDDDDDDDCAK